MLLVLLVFVSLMSFSSGEIMVMDIITHWETNKIGYINTENFLMTQITPNEEVLFYIEKENNIVMIMFDYNEYSDEIMNDFLFTTKLPFSIQTRKDILELLSKKVNYVLTFEKIPSDTKGFIGNEYYVQSGIQISNDYVVLLLKDLG